MNDVRHDGQCIGQALDIRNGTSKIAYSEDSYDYATQENCAKRKENSVFRDEEKVGCEEGGQVWQSGWERWHYF